MELGGKFIYTTAVDISVENGPGINEREFVRELCKSHGSEVACVLPYPATKSEPFGSEVHFVINHRRYNPAAYFMYTLAAFLRIRKICRRERIEALVFRLDVFPFVALMATFLTKTPVILKTMAGYLSFDESATAKQRLTAKLAKPLFKVICRRAIAVDTVSPAYIDWLTEVYSVPFGRIEVIPNGADANGFRPGDRAEARSALELTHFKYIVGYVGALSVIRNVGIMLKAVSTLKEKMNLGLVLVGGGPDRETLSRMAAEMGILENVVFTGHVPYSKVPLYMRAFDIAMDLTFVGIISNQGTANASYSQKIPQYLCCGLPVIACDVPDNRFLEEEEIGKLVAIRDVTGLTGAIEFLMNRSADERVAMSLRARAYAERVLSVSALTERRLNFWRNTVRSIRQPFGRGGDKRECVAAERSCAETVDSGRTRPNEG